MPPIDQQPGWRFRLRLLFTLLVGAFTLIFFQLWYLQVVRGEYFHWLAENNQFKTVPIPAPRGIVLDRHGAEMASGRMSFNCWIQKDQLPTLSPALRQLAEPLALDPGERETALAPLFADPYRSALLLQADLSLDQVAFLEARRHRFPYLSIEVQMRRAYAAAETIVHPVGYVGEIGPLELERRPYHRVGEPVGKDGIERQYDPELTGVSGWKRVVVNHLGREMKVYTRQLPVAGRTLETTLDLRLQALARAALGDRVGAVVVLDPRDGAVRALVSTPAFDPNALTRALSRAEWRRIADNPRRPLRNKGVRDIYPPGSTFKVVVTQAALETGTITPKTVVACPGYLRVGDHTFHCHERGGHGRLDLMGALTRSCNVYFYTVGRRLGLETLTQYASRFGVGEPTGIDLPLEVAGSLPDLRRAGPGEVISMAIGQGALTVTPLQMARIAAAVANGGFLMQPYLVARIVDPETGAAVIPHRRPPEPIGVSAPTLALLREGLWRVVHAPGGTGVRARSRAVELLGKTGTAQVVSLERREQREEVAPEWSHHAWFIGYTPREAPVFAFAILVEHGETSSLAAELAREIFEAYAAPPEPAPPAETPPPVLAAAALPPEAG